MDLPIRTLLIWLLVLALPVQGAAATTMAFCGPQHHGGAAAAVTNHSVTAGHVHDRIEAAVAHVHAGADAPAPAADGLDVPAKAKGGAADSHKCNVCGSCCSTGALISAVPTFPAANAASTVFSTVVATVDPFTAGGPDRPPRNLLV